jgi:hypothetical protein
MGGALLWGLLPDEASEMGSAAERNLTWKIFTDFRRCHGEKFSPIF